MNLIKLTPTPASSKLVMPDSMPVKTFYLNVDQIELIDCLADGSGSVFMIGNSLMPRQGQPPLCNGVYPLDSSQMKQLLRALQDIASAKAQDV